MKVDGLKGEALNLLDKGSLRPLTDEIGLVTKAWRDARLGVEKVVHSRQTHLRSAGCVESHVVAAGGTRKTSSGYRGMAKLGDIRIGVSGWTYSPWRGTFYPPGLPQKR